MSTINKTPNLHLPQYTPEDVFDMVEINEAYSTIDATYIEMKENRDEVVALAEGFDKAEALRVSSENIRISAENNRANAESSRVNAEKNRVASFNNIVTTNETFKTDVTNTVDTFVDKVNADMYDSKIDFFGKEHDKLEHRLNADFDNVHQRINDSELLPYEGTSIKADNTYYGLQKDTVVKGRTLQNLWTKQTTFIANIETSMLYDTAHLLKSNTTYTLITSITDSSFSYTMGSIYSISYESSTEYNLLKDSLKDGLKLQVFTTKNESIKSIGVGMHGNNDSSSKCTFNNIMILEGDHTQTPLEELPFIEGIDSVGDKTKNLINPNTILDNTTINGNGAESSDNRYISTDFIKVEPNTSYFASGLTVGYEYDNNKNFIRVISNTSKDNTFLTSSNGGYVRLRNFNFLENKESKQEIISSCMLHVGTQATPYQEYYDGYKVSGKSCGVNLAKEISQENYASNGSGEVKFENNKCIAMDKSGWSSCNIIGKDAIKVKPNTIYYGGIECEEDLSQARLTYKCFDINNNVIKTSRTVTLSNDAVNFYASTYNSTYEAFLPLTNHYKYVKFSSEVHSVKLIFRPISSSGTITNTFKNIIFAETDKEPTYEPYQESNYSYILNEPLRSLPNRVCDTIDLETGVLTRSVGVLRITGEENWGALNTSNDMYNESSCNMNFEKVYLEETNSISSFTTQTAHSRIVSPRNNVTVWIRVPKTIDTLEKFKAHVKNGEAYGELAEPTTEQLTPQQLKSFDTTTHIISDNKLMPVISTKIPSNVQAIISTLRLENSDLKNNVEVLTVENEELKSVNNVQDEMIDINMLATDEVYSLIEPLLLDMLSERGVSKLVDMYVAMVQRGLKTLDEVPARYREQVISMIQDN